MANLRQDKGGGVFCCLSTTTGEVAHFLGHYRENLPVPLRQRSQWFDFVDGFDDTRRLISFNLVHD